MFKFGREIRSLVFCGTPRRRWKCRLGRLLLRQDRWASRSDGGAAHFAECVPTVSPRNVSLVDPFPVSWEPCAGFERLDEVVRPLRRVDGPREELLRRNGRPIRLGVGVLPLYDDGSFNGDATEEASGFGVAVPEEGVSTRCVDMGMGGTNMAATLPFVFRDPEASPLRPRGPSAILILPPNVSDPAAMNEAYQHCQWGELAVDASYYVRSPGRHQ